MNKTQFLHGFFISLMQRIDNGSPYIEPWEPPILGPIVSQFSASIETNLGQFLKKILSQLLTNPLKP